MSDHDVVVVGGGPAGLSAALVLARARRRVAVVDAGRPRNAPAAHMQGFLSRDGLPPRQLLALGRAEVAGYGGELVDGTVVQASRTARGFAVVLADGRRLTGRRLLVTTGLRDELPELPGVAERFGRDVLHCPYCHGWEVRDRRLGVLATSPAAMHQVQLVRQWSDDVVLLTHGTTPTPEQAEQLAARGIAVVDGEVVGLVVEDDALRGVHVDGDVVPLDALFVAPRFVPDDAVLAALGCALDDDGFAVVDRTGRASTRGVWAAGNAVHPRAQVITAAGDGSAAATALNADLVEEDVRDAVAQLRLAAHA